MIKKAFDCNVKLSYDKALAFKTSGYDGVIRYVGRLTQATFDLDAKEAADILRAGLALAVVQHCCQPGWIPGLQLGTTYGVNAAAFAQAAGVQKETIIYLDLEGIKPGTPKADIISFSNAWYDKVDPAFTPGIYIGYNMFLTGDDLFNSLKFQHYWKSFSQVPDVTKRGYEMLQGEQITVNGIQIDPDTITGDHLGNFPIFMYPAKFKTKTINVFSDGSIETI